MRSTDAPKSRAADMARSRARKRAAGLVEFRAWVTPKEKKMLAEALKRAREILEG